jgi:hypothetical protein
MEGSFTRGRSRSFTNMSFHPTAVALVIAAAIIVCGCGGSISSSAPGSSPSAQDAKVTGQYNLVLTSSNGHGATNIYTDFTQTGTAFTGAATTLVCPSNDLSQCKGDDASITPSGTVSGQNVTMMISFPTTAGADTVTIVGSATGPNLAGTYTDSLGDAGTWTAFAPSPFSGTFSGTFNSTSKPLSIAPTILFTLSQDARFNLTGSATIMNSPCISSLTLSGQAIGGAFSLADSGNEADIIALPDVGNLNFGYTFKPNAANCAGDVGRGTVSKTSGPFDY